MDNGRPTDAPVGSSAEHARAGDVTAGDLVRAVAALIEDVLSLVALEGRLAVVSLVVMLAAGIVVAILALSAWFFLLAAVAAGLVASGWSWAAVLLCMVAANGILALLCWLVIRWLSHNLLFAATRRALRPRASGLPNVSKTDPTQS